MTTVAPTVSVVVPGAHLMAELLGQRDELLRRVEDAFPDVAVVVRGNEIGCSGPRAHQVGRLFEEMVLLLQSGERLDQSVTLVGFRIGQVSPELRENARQALLSWWQERLPTLKSVFFL
jgi:hypothetical protein